MIIKKMVNFIRNGNRLNRLYSKFGKPTIIHNKVLINKDNQDKLLKKFKIQFKSLIDNFELENKKQEKVNIIWVFWYQGLNDAPPIVNKCIESQKKYAKDYEIRILTKDNLFDYVTLPSYITDKFEKKIIPFTQYSDIIRITLLAEYGGIWLDSTVLLTGELPNYIRDSKLFVYKEYTLDRSDTLPIVSSSWLISAYTNQPIIILTKELLYEYWKRENRVKDYFIFHIIFSVVTEHFKEDWKLVPGFSNINPHILLFEFLEEFDKRRFDEIKMISSVHKLNRRLINEDVGKYTYYDYIIENDI